MTKRLFLILILFCSLSLNAQNAFYGKLWANGQESECNWFFDENRACMQLKFSTGDSVMTDARVIMHSGSGKLEFITYSNGQRSVFTTHADSIVIPTDFEPINFFTSGLTSEFAGIGNCTKYQGRNLKAQYVMYLTDTVTIDLSAFQLFFRGDESFYWVSKNQPHSFPVNTVKVSASGELIQSFLVHNITNEIPQGIWQ